MHGFSYDPIHDEIVVNSPLTQAILTFRGSVNGEEPPIRVIQGPKTKILGADTGALNTVTADPEHNEIFLPVGNGLRGGGTGSVSSQMFGPLANQYTVNVTNVSNAQHLNVTLDGVQDIAGALINNSIARMDLLLGDTTADGTVNSADITQTRRQSGNTAHGDPNANFREDVTADGTINSADITAVRRQSGTALP